MQFVKSNLHYPAEVQDKGISGRGLVKFVVNANGSIGAAKVTRRDEALGNKALRLVRPMPLWTPGKQGGECKHLVYTSCFIQLVVGLS